MKAIDSDTDSWMLCHNDESEGKSCRSTMAGGSSSVMAVPLTCGENGHDMNILPQHEPATASPEVQKPTRERTGSHTDMLLAGPHPSVPPQLHAQASNGSSLLGHTSELSITHQEHGVRVDGVQRDAVQLRVAQHADVQIRVAQPRRRVLDVLRACATAQSAW